MLLIIVSAVAPAWGQQFGAEDEHVPDWLTDLGYDPDEDESFSNLEQPSSDGSDNYSWMDQDGTAEPGSSMFEGDQGPLGASSGQRRPMPSGAQQPSDTSFKCLLCRDKLTGDWLGYRSRLQKSGIMYRGRTTHFFFGVGGGVNPPPPINVPALGIVGGDRYEYTGNSRHDLLIDLDKFGGLPHSKFVITMENIWGRWGNVGFETGAVSPVIFNSVMPVDPEAHGVPRLTNFMLVQPLSEKFILTAGKTRTVGVADNNIFAGGDGSDQFLNQTLIANPLLVPQIPLSTFIVGAAMPQEWGHIGVSVLDTIERSTEYFDFESLYSEGAIILGQIQVDTHFFGKPGEQHVTGFYKNSDQLDLAFNAEPNYPYPPGSPLLQQVSSSYAICYGFDQYLSVFGPPDRRGHEEGWGLFGRAGIADDARGNPNFLAWHTSIGVGGSSVLHSRRGKGDRWGIGYAYSGASSEFGPVPQALLGPRDPQLIEAYYRYRWTPAIEITPDIQWIRGLLGGLTDGDEAVVFGIRMNMHL
jgi:porin